ncbi:ArnT family glycosyltransferase [Runella zeae]|uniref:ArnT family glycosyltransferase n=1 Tax=Runella zeae TaxID=94255 RepID=UPI00041305D9|nr:glycosyltransferase family 39 protein [Runella zeae]
MSIPKRVDKWAVVVFFLGYFLVGLLSFRDYGISFDELVNRGNAVVSAQYLTELAGIKADASNNIPKLHQYRDKDYGVVFELPLLLAEKALRLNTDNKSQALFYFRHFCTFLVFFVGVFFFFLTAYRWLKNTYVALVGTTFLILTPRIFAESFYNGKDVVCLAFFMIATYFLIEFVRYRRFWDGVWLAFFTAVSINMRPTGLILPVVAMGWLVIDGVQIPSLRRPILRLGAIQLGLVVVFTVALWPYLWENPIAHFGQVLQNMSKFRFTFPVLFLGKSTPAPQLPRYYAMVYVLITTPIVYLLLWVVGGFRIIQNTLKDIRNIGLHREAITFLGLSVGPFVAVALLHSVLYDGWRQLYFAYGAFMLVAMRGLVYLTDEISLSRWLKTSLIVVTSFYILYIGWWMYQNHPYQNVYFNTLAPKPIASHFERDYWGLSYRQALEYIAAHDNRPHLEVIANLKPGYLNQMMLSESAKKRIHCEHITPEERKQKKASELECDYFITEYRYAPSPFPYEKELYSIEVDGFKIMSVFDGKIKK